MKSNRIALLATCVALVVVTMIVYYPALSCGFVTYDDPGYVSQNVHVLNGLSLAGWNYAWTSWDCSNWHPLTWLSLQTDGHFWRNSPVGYHATNLVFHVINSVLLLLLLNRLTNCLFCSACVAAIFAVHPLHVESVTWVAERKDVLSTFFLLLTLLAYEWYSTRPSVVRYLTVLVLFAFGLLSKPMLVTLPVLLLLLDYWPLDRVEGVRLTIDSLLPKKSVRRLLVEKLPLLSLSFLDGLMTVAAQRNAAKVLENLSLGSRLANAADAYVWYLKKTFVPVDLIVFYPHPQSTLPVVTIVVDLFILAAMSCVAVRFARSKPHLIVGWLWFVISLLPVIGLFQVGGQAYADRYSYVPHIGLFVAIVWEAYAWLSKTTVSRVVGVISAVGAVVVCGMLSHSQLRHWKSSDALWTHALNVIPENGVAHAHLSDVRFEAGDYTGAIEHIERAVKLEHSGYLANAYCNWGKSLLALARPEEAEQKLWEALKVDRFHERSLDELAKLFKKQGRSAEAKQMAARHDQVLVRMAEKEPNNPSAQLTIGLFKARQGDVNGAIAHFEAAVRLAPQSASAHHNLAFGLLQVKRLKEAKAHFIRAIELDPDLAVAHFGLAEMLEREKDFEGAKEQYTKTLQLNPSDVEAKRRLDRLANQ